MRVLVEIRRAALVGLVMAVCGLGSSAQHFTEPFNYGGTTLGAWVEHLGDWQAVSNQARTPQNISTGDMYLTLPSQSFVHGVIEADVSTNTLSTFQVRNAGVTLRTLDPNNGRNMISFFLRSNLATPNLWNRGQIFEYYHDRSGGATRGNTPTINTSSARIRLIVAGSRATGLVDSDLNGSWDLRSVAFQAATNPVMAGPIGLAGQGHALIDNVAVYNAAVQETDFAITPRLGFTTSVLIFGQASLAYQAACSFGNGGIPIGGGRSIPLTADALFGLTAGGALPAVFQSFAGVLDANGQATVGIAPPNDPALVGLVMYFAFVTANGSTIVGISQDVRMQLQ